jgi:hypothetical protein
MIKTETIKKYALPVAGFLTIAGIGIAISMNVTGKKIVKEAKKYVGQLELRTGGIENQGWQNKYFENLMKQMGWQQGFDYCVLFTKLILLNSLTGKKREIVLKLWKPNSQVTWANLINNQNLGLYKLSKTATPGAVAVYKHMNKEGRGHADIVGERVEKERYEVITANGSVGVEEKFRKYAFESSGMRLLGFVKF